MVKLSVFTIFLSLYVVNGLSSCDPPPHYPQISNIKLLSSSTNSILLKLKNEDLSEFCIMFEINENEMDSSTFSSEVICASYNDILLDFQSDTDSTETRINSITSETGIDITRNTHSFVIGWDQIAEIGNITIDSHDIETFTLNSEIINEYTTFLRLSADDIYAIKFESLTSNNYDIYTVSSNEWFNLESDVKSYAQYKFISFTDKFSSCNKQILYQYAINISPDDDIYDLNLTQIATDYNIYIDIRNNYGYLWGYSATFKIFDILEDSISYHRYGVNQDTPTNHVYAMKNNLYPLFIINIIILSLFGH